MASPGARIFLHACRIQSAQLLLFYDNAVEKEIFRKCGGESKQCNIFANSVLGKNCKPQFDKSVIAVIATTAIFSHLLCLVREISAVKY
jgi:hypothetical protein